jgi:hypothetical protein
MKIIKLLKNKENIYETIIFNDDLTVLCPHETFDDLYTLNFYLQSMQKKLNFGDSLIIVHDKFNNSVEILKNNGEIFFD